MYFFEKGTYTVYSRVWGNARRSWGVFENLYNTIQYIENLYSAAIQKCPGVLTILKYIKTKIKSICDECTLEQKCLKPFLEYILCEKVTLQSVMLLLTASYRKKLWAAGCIACSPNNFRLPPVAAPMFLYDPAMIFQLILPLV